MSDADTTATDPTPTPTPAADPADRYLDEVRWHLLGVAGLSDDEREEMLDDLAAHLHEVAADEPRPLHETLGPPARFAAELLASAGLEGSAPAGRTARLGRLRAQGRRLADHRWTRAAVAYLLELRPAWWVLRAYLIVLGLAALFANGVDDLSAFPVPSLGSPIVGLVAVAAAIVASVRLGQSAAATGQSHAGVRLVNGAAVLLALVALVHVRDGLQNGSELVESAYADPGVANTGGTGLTSTDGMPVTNIYAYDERGELLSDVLLYDQDGNPIDLGDALVDPTTGDELVTDYPVDGNGAQIRNGYPLDQRAAEWGQDGVRRERAVRPPAVVVPPPSSTTTTTR